MQHHAYNYHHKISPSSQLTTLNSGITCSIDLISTNVKISDIFPIYTVNYYEHFETPLLKLETEVSSRCTTYRSGRVISHSLRAKIDQGVVISIRKSPTETMQNNRMIFYVRKFEKHSDRIYLTMDSCTVERVSRVSAQLFYRK